MVKKKSTLKRKRILIKTREGNLTSFTKISPGKFAFIFKKNGKIVIGKSRFKTKGALQKKFVQMVKKK